MVIRRLRVATPTRFLTFDDGPVPEGTPAVLDVLARHDVKATFFVVADHARRAPALLLRIVAAGHAVGNHSLDHRYRNYIKGSAAMVRWIADAERALQDLSGGPTVGFRSPAGVRTPPLAHALRVLGMAHVHWQVRFYDAIWAWRRAGALASLGRTPPGSIVLLHDRQRPENLPVFLDTLDAYLAAAAVRGWSFAPLEHDLCSAAETRAGTLLPDPGAQLI